LRQARDCAFFLNAGYLSVAPFCEALSPSTAVVIVFSPSFFSYSSSFSKPGGILVRDGFVSTKRARAKSDCRLQKKSYKSALRLALR
jgi:hypothetical protein